MLPSHNVNAIKSSVKRRFFNRNISIHSPCLEKATDPIQQLFIDKIREYRVKSNGGKNLVEPTKELQDQLRTQLRSITKQYQSGKKKIDLNKFPTFKWVDPKIDSIFLEPEPQPGKKVETKTETKVEVKTDTKTVAKTETKPEAKTEAKTETKTKTKTETKTETKTDTKTVAKTEEKSEEKNKTKTVAKTENQKQSDKKTDEEKKKK